MSHLLPNLTPEFFRLLLLGMAVNFEIAAAALALGLALAVPLVLLRLGGGIFGRVASVLVALMRASPTFVVMFFLLNALPRGIGLSGAMIVAVALVPYAAAYIADSGVDAVRQLRAGSRLAGLLILPNIARSFFVMVMSSSAGAAIGVREGIAVILRQAEQAHGLGEILVLAAIGVICFGVPLQLGFAIIRVIQAHLGRPSLPEEEAALTGEATVPVEQG
jgi:ABC-type amino acid transport system permease subunit